MWKSHPPPVPPAGRSDKGPARRDRGAPAERGKTAQRTPPDNPAEQDRQGNIRENTRQQAYQQDR
jgi:hypothetical protein